jgi:hypothetical protein
LCDWYRNATGLSRKTARSRNRPSLEWKNKIDRGRNGVTVSERSNGGVTPSYVKPVLLAPKAVFTDADLLRGVKGWVQGADDLRLEIVGWCRPFSAVNASLYFDRRILEILPSRRRNQMSRS